MNEFPTEEEIRERYCASKKFLPTQEKIIFTSDYYDAIRIDMPDGYKHFSKTKPMLLEHFADCVEW